MLLLLQFPFCPERWSRERHQKKTRITHESPFSLSHPFTFGAASCLYIGPSVRRTDVGTSALLSYVYSPIHIVASLFSILVYWLSAGVCLIFDCHSVFLCWTNPSVSFCLTFRLSVSLFVSQSDGQLSVCLSVGLSLCLCVCLCVVFGLSACRSVFVSLFISLSVCW